MEKSISTKDSSSIIEELELLEQEENNVCLDETEKRLNANLFDYQKIHVDALVNSISNNNRALDSSDTGTGKTRCAIATAIKLKLKVFIICPKSVLNTWLQTLRMFKCDYYGTTNYESLHNCKYYPYTDELNPKKTRCPFLSLKKSSKIKEFKGKEIIKKTYDIVWNLPADCLIIIDEVHKCKNKQTMNAQFLATLSQSNAKILMLSATTCETPDKFLVAGLCLGFYKTLKDGKLWIEALPGDYELEKMIEINKLLFPAYGSRMRIKQIKDLFPNNTIIADCIEMDCQEEIEKEYKKIEEAVRNLKNKEDNSGSVLARILYARMRIEQLKIPIFKKIITQYLNEGASVAVFVNFTGTLLTLADEFKTTCLVYGEQSLDERNAAINRFKTDKERIIICNIRSGGVGISLHDEIGKYKRVSVISPCYSAQDVLQTLGRINRAGTKTDTLQRIIYCKGTVEERACKCIKRKIMNISNMNDGQRDTYVIKNLLEANDEVLINEEISEFDKMYLKINVLNIKKERLTDDLKKIEQEIIDLTTKIEQHIGYD
jgi:hypothetical protein